MLNFGESQAGVELERIFKLENLSTGSVIREVKSSCSCLNGYVDDKAIGPGEGIKIRLQLRISTSIASLRDPQAQYGMAILFDNGPPLFFDVRATVLGQPVISPAGCEIHLENNATSFTCTTTLLVPDWAREAPVVKEHSKELDVRLGPVGDETGRPFNEIKLTAFGCLGFGVSARTYQVAISVAGLDTLYWRLQVYRTQLIRITPNPLLLVRPLPEQVRIPAVQFSSLDLAAEANPPRACTASLSEEGGLLLSGFSEDLDSFEIVFSNKQSSVAVPVYVLEYAP